MTTLAPEIMSHALLSEGVIAYLGLGTAPTPQRNVRAVEAIDHDGSLILATRTVIHQVLKFETDDLLGLDIIGEQVADHTRLVCPELSERAVEAIVWNYTLGWR